MNGGPPRIFSFGNFRMDAEERALLRDGEQVPLSSKAFDVLAVLVENRGRLVTKDALYQRVWADTIVEDANLAVHVSAIRKALGDPELIQTVKGHGYRFTGDVLEHVEAPHEYVIESRTFSRVTIEQEKASAEQEISERAVQLPTVSKWSPRRVLFVSLAGIFLVASAGFALRYAVLSSDRAPARGFQIGSVKRLTTTGRVATAAAISPDGKLFAYTQFDDDLESLWLGHTNGGDPMQIRPPSPVKYGAVRFSPDGNHIFYTATDVGGRSLFRMPVFGGAPEKIRDGVNFNIAFAPDGNKFAFIRGGKDPALVTFDLRTGSEEEVVRPPARSGFVPYSPAWSPDGETIAVAAPIAENTTAHEVFVVRIADRSLKQLTNHNWERVEAAVWANDGKSLIVVANEKDSRLNQLWSAEFPAGTVEPIVSDLNIYDFAISSTAASDALLTIQVQQFSNIWSAPADELTEAKQITFSSLGRIDGWSGIDYTPTGKIVYTAVAENATSIWMMDADGSDQVQLTPTGQSCFHPSASDDGRTIVFTCMREGRHSIWRVGSEGSALRQLTDVESAGQAHISPDGTWVVFITHRDNFGDMYRIPSSGGEAIRMTDRKASWVRISPDGRLIAASFLIDGQSKLGIMSVETGELIRTFDIPRTYNFRLGVRWTPDGKAVAYRDWARGIWKQSLDGGPPERLPGLPDEKLFGYDWSSDGKQFVFSRGSEIRDVVLIGNQK